MNQNFPQFSSTSDKRCDILLYFIEILFWTFWILLTFPYYLKRTNILFWMMGEIAAIRRGSYQMHLPSQRWDYMGSLRIHFDAMQKLSAYRLWCLLPGFAYCCPALIFVARLWVLLPRFDIFCCPAFILLPGFDFCCPALVFVAQLWYLLLPVSEICCLALVFVARLWFLLAVFDIYHRWLVH